MHMICKVVMGLLGTSWERCCRVEDRYEGKGEDGNSNDQWDEKKKEEEVETPSG